MSVRQPIQFPSRTGEGNIQAALYWPDDLAAANGILVQIVHGMAEHMNRYDAFCRYLTGQGMAVCIHDLAGHGRSASAADRLGYFGAADGCEKMPQDIDELAAIAQARLAEQPGGRKTWRRILLGHSMGSFISRYYVAHLETPLAGVILIGTSGANPAVGLGLFLAGWSIRRHGALYHDEFLAKLTAQGMLKKIAHPQTAVDWLTHDQAIIAAYNADPLCGFTFTAAGYRDLYRWLKEISSEGWAARVPGALPVLLLGGGEDPVSQYGRGPRQVGEWLINTGHQVDIKIYPEDRHEILNELDRAQVWQDITSWMKRLPETGIPGKEPK